MLDWKVGYSPIEDALRYLIIPAGITVFCTSLYQIHCLFKVHRTQAIKQACRYAALMILGLVACLQEWDQLGEPMVWWRLPLIFIALVFAFIGTIGEGRRGRSSAN